MYDKDTKMKPGYMLAPHEQQTWQRLDNQIYYACRELEMEFGILCFTPAQPWVMGYLCTHNSRRAFHACLDKSRNWFKLFLSQLSFLIAASSTLSKLEQQKFPIPGPERENVEGVDWKDILLSNSLGVGIDQWWIDFLLEMTVVCYTAERVGVFLDLEKPGKSPYHSYQPDPAWFCAYNVPVWYPWMTNQIQNQKLAHLAPLPYQIQEATTFLSKSPSSSPILASNP